MTFESIPGCIIQVQTIVWLYQAGTLPSSAALISVIISALSTGFTSAIFTFDYDVDPAGRAMDPDFYGMIPDGSLGRTIVFVCLVLQSALLLLIRSLGAAMLMEIGELYFLGYMTLDHGLFWVNLFARNDALVFLGSSSDNCAHIIIGTFLVRTAFKVIVDYTGLVQFRGPGLVGGAYFSVNMVMAFVVSFASIYMYFERFEGEVEEDDLNDAGDDADDSIGLEKEAVLSIAITVSVAWLLVTGLILLLIKRKYARTFFSTQTTREWVMDYFLKGETDEVKSQIVRNNPRCWTAIRPQVRAWLLENWGAWETDKPVWFDDVWMSFVDDDMMPAWALKRLRQKGGGMRRRSSLGDAMGGSVRERRGSTAVAPAPA
jgi:hypothetical protein